MSASDTPPPASPATTTRRTTPHDREALRHLCWGLLFHMLGLEEDSKQRFQELEKLDDSPDHAPVSLLKGIANGVKHHQGSKDAKERSQAHKGIVWALGDILHPESEKHKKPGPNLNKECGRRSGYREAKDSPEKGYSRDPFKAVAEEHKPEIGLAAISYLLRAHSFYFHRPRGERTFNAAKVALNDLFQASQLGCRLYYSLDVCHTREHSQDRYIEEVRLGPDHARDPWLSSYYIWWILSLVEIQRGNVYRQLHYLHEADRHYRHLQARFRRLAQDPLAIDRQPLIPTPEDHPSTDRWFITPTLIRTLTERSKVLFDRGRFIESMMCQILALAFLARTTLGSGKLPSHTELALSKIAKGLRFLDVTRRESVWDKGAIHGLFAEARSDEDAPLGVLLTAIFTSWLKHLDSTHRKLATDLYARIALTLFIFRTKPQLAALPTLQEEGLRVSANETTRNVNLSRFLTIDKNLDIDPAAIVSDARIIIDPPGREVLPAALPGSLERSLARSLHLAVRRKKRLNQQYGEMDFLKAVLEVATQSIQNVVTIPLRAQDFLIRPGYKERRRSGDLSGACVAEALGPRETSQETRAKPRSSGRKDRQRNQDAGEEPAACRGKLKNKLVVLRRWQSFTPKIPRPHGDTVRGGGYFLLWGGKGIVIDPGYDFLQNFYDEGFSLDDIDAVVVTHSHPDHEDDLSTLSTLVKEWNDHHSHMGGGNPAVKLDLLLNESAHLKFSNWLKASDFGIGRIIPLPLVVWDLHSEAPCEVPRGGNVRLNLRNTYCFDLEIVPAWHDDVIGKTAAVGLKFHLYSPEDRKREVGIVGLTSDTGAYPWPANRDFGELALIDSRRTGRGQHDAPNDERKVPRVEEEYKHCDVLVAHLGDVRLRELFSVMDRPGGGRRLGSRVEELLLSTFCVGEHASREKVNPSTIGEFFTLLVTLRIAPSSALEASIDASHTPAMTVAHILDHYIRGKQLPLRGLRLFGQMGERLRALAETYRDRKISTKTAEHLARAVKPGAPPETRLQDWQIAYALVGFLCAASLSRWRYKYHLGITGLYRVQQALLHECKKCEDEGLPGRGKVLVVGELPEELSSYRHWVARLLNFTEGNFDNKGRRRVHAFTGDIGLHISLDVEMKGKKRVLEPKIRCTYCNYNNETVLGHEPSVGPGNYHPPEKIMETPLKRLDSAMIYLCTEHDHHPENEAMPHDFLSRPALRVI